MMRAIFLIICMWYYCAMCINVEDTKCQVYEELTFKHFRSPSVEFTAWISKGQFFRILVKYKKEYDSIKITSNEITLKRKEKDTQRDKVFNASLSFGWLDFILTIDEKLSLRDEHKVLFSIPLNKKVDSVTIDSGMVMLYCRSHIPTWKIGGKTTNIPLNIGFAEPEHQLSFYSQNIFKPEIQLNEHKESLGTLEPNILHVFTLNLSAEDGLTLELKQGDRRIAQIILSKNVSSFDVKGDHSDCFYMRQIGQNAYQRKSETNELEPSTDKGKQPNRMSSACSTQDMETNNYEGDAWENSPLWLYVALGVAAILLIIKFAIILFMLRKMAHSTSESRPVSEHTYEEIDEDAVAKSLQIKKNHGGASDNKTSYYLEPILSGNQRVVPQQENK